MVSMAAATASSIGKRLFFHHPPPFQPPKAAKFRHPLIRDNHAIYLYPIPFAPVASFLNPSTSAGTRSNGTDKKKSVSGSVNNGRTFSEQSFIKRRTRSGTPFDEDNVRKFGDSSTHVPVMLGEVLQVFGSSTLLSFVDCTLGAAGHSSAMIQAHPEMQLYVGLDVDPLAYEMAHFRIHKAFQGDIRSSSSDWKVHILLKNFRDIKSILHEVNGEVLSSGVDGILMDLGMSSMQVNNAERGFSVLSNGPLDMRMNPHASLKAEDILNSWPGAEVGRILLEYGEESNWRILQNKIIEARLSGGLHSTGALVNLIRNSTPAAKATGGRHGWIKTATRVFQALRIAVNDELRTLEDSLHACFDCLAPGSRLAVISFHSLEDRIVKKTFLDIITSKDGGDAAGIKGEKKKPVQEIGKINFDVNEKEVWIKQMVRGSNGMILTKRPITPSEEEERLNSRSRSAKLRVIEKI